ncbi:uncharacterized protein E5676_scaffold360G00980 [Cucumis melo var. makuwa]|uniref:DUF4218 domain-containing protein n=1 Tax=Cucumis melo var. makuwa TaxID=1194695 RepID=A0A5A7T0V1_CUCMM|nr:uncharacterized protein E6C27_scaffold147G00040 [Cucumis melo var. makuwa]TYK00049.1 uncharacterized protein E5676_scaffold360G00980 [Cucumis melo var. makuwa]
MVHLVKEVKLYGPVYLRWMYPFERYMKVLKSFVRNRNRPEGCIAEAQVCEDAVQFCSVFLSGLDPIGLGSPNSRKDKQTDRPLSAETYVRLDRQQLKQVSSAKDKNPVIGDMSFYGIIEDIWEPIGHSSDSFIIATDGKQEFYVSDPVDARWSIVVMPPQKDFSYKCANDDLRDMLPHYPQSQNGIQQVTLMKVGIHTLDLTVKTYGLLLDFHRMLLHRRKEEKVVHTKKRGPTEIKEITRARSEGQRLVIEYNELGQAIGQNATKLKSFIGTTVRFYVPITYSDWPTVPKEIKDKIFELIKAGFVVDPRSKKTIIQNAGVCFRQFKYKLTTIYVLPFLDNVEKLKFPSNEYSFIDQQHWTEFVASRLKEDFKKKNETGKEKRNKHKYNHRTSRKGYANLIEELKASSLDQIDRSIVWKQARMDHKGQIPDEETKKVVNLIDELVATQKTTNAFGEEDILTRTLGGKDCPGIVCGVGKYVTKKKYFNTATQQKTNEKEDEKATSKEHDQMAKRIKELEDELLKMKEKDDCLGDLKEEPGMGSKEKSSMEGAENLNDFEDLSNDLESQKDVEDVVELNEEIKVNIVKDDEQVEGMTLEKMKLAFETKDHVVTWGTTFDSDVEGDNVKVAVDVVVDGD